MVSRNIHGLWSMHFEERILYSKITGGINTEMSMAWFEDMKHHVLIPIKVRI